MKIVATSGYFAPIHRGHIELFERAKKLGYLVVIVNNDRQLKDNKGRLYPIEDRVAVIEQLKCVDNVFISIDKDRSVCKSLTKIKPDIFAKGGDRFSGEIPETKVCKKLGIKIIDGLGKKIQSSSWIIQNVRD